MKSDICGKCGAVIWLVPKNPKDTRQRPVRSFMWVTNPKQSGSWHCGHDPMHPVRAHSPAA